jgi:hypothetical protein
MVRRYTVLYVHPLSSTQRDDPIEDNSSEELERPPNLGNQDMALFERAHPGPNIHTYIFVLFRLFSLLFTLCSIYTVVKKGNVCVLHSYI